MTLPYETATSADHVCAVGVCSAPSHCRVIGRCGAQQKRAFDAAYLRSIASALSYQERGEAVRKHRLNEIALRIETGGYA
jgi:hypothetical protein